MELPPGSRSQYGISNEELAHKYSQYKIKAKSGMDMLGFLRLRAWDATREQEKKKPQQRFIDEVWLGVKPGM